MWWQSGSRDPKSRERLGSGTCSRVGSATGVVPPTQLCFVGTVPLQGLELDRLDRIDSEP